jgi:hypothetical protein
MKHTLVVLALLLASGAAQAQVPREISYQGVLTDNSGNLVADGSYNLTFHVYTTASGVSPIWAETQIGVAVTRGGFSVLLGAVTPLSLPFNVPYWLAIAVNGSPELSPRVQFASSPYAVRADTSRAVQLPYSALVTQTGVAPFTLQNNGGGVPAILGQTNSNAANSYGLRGVSGGSNPAATSAGVRGENFATDSFSAGIWGSQNGIGRGVYGFTPGGYGVFGESTTGAGLYGYSLNGTPILGQAVNTLANGSAILGVLGSAPGNGASAVRGNAGAKNGANTVGVWGQNDGGGTGVFGECATGTGSSGNSASGTGVWGSTSTGVALLGTSAAGGTAARLNAGSSTGTALEVQQGALKVTGAGLNTATTAFQVQVTTGGFGNILISNPLCDGDPSAILIVTRNYRFNGATDDCIGCWFPFGVKYSTFLGTNNWNIVRMDGDPIPVGTAFNILVIKTQ